MAEEEGPSEDEEVPPEPKGSRLNQFIILAVVVLLCQSALAYVLVTHYVIPRQRAALGLEEEETTTLAKARREVVPVNVPPVYPMEEILVNPMDKSELRYLNCLVSLELENEDVLAELQDKLVATRVRDLVFRTLGTIPVSKMETTEQRQAIKQVLKDRINESGLLTSGEVTGILFERFVLH